MPTAQPHASALRPLPWPLPSNRSFNVSAPYHHDVSLAGGALLNVVSAGAGADLNLDLHREGAWGNLFSQLHCGACSRPFKSGGREGRGAHSGRQNSFWNVGSPPRPAGAPAPAPAPAPIPAPPPAQPGEEAAGSGGGGEGSSRRRRMLGGVGQQQRRRMLGGVGQQQRRAPRRRLQDEAAGSSPVAVELPPCSFGPLLNFIGGNLVGDPCPGSDWLVKGLGADAPSDLHVGQLAERRATQAAAPGGAAR